MTDNIPAGFVPVHDPDPVFQMIGPLYRGAETAPEAPVFAMRADHRHINKRQVVHGGMLVSLIDTTLAVACWNAGGGGPCATITLNTEFLGPARDGDWLVARAEVTRLTRSLVFVKGQLFAGDNLVLTANGVWKRLGAD